MSQSHDRSDSSPSKAPDSHVQPEEGSPRSPEEQQIRGRSSAGSERAQQNAGDDVGEAPEEA